MSAFRISDIVTFFITIGACLVFAAIWIIVSERRRNILRGEIRKLKAQIESYEREKFMLLEKISMLESATVQNEERDSWAGQSAETERILLETRQNKAAVEAENNRLKRELAEARGSLEEVYKALK